MTFKVKIEMGNDSMRTVQDVALALVDVAKRVARGDCDGARIRDANGNTVGAWAIVLDRDGDG